MFNVLIAFMIILLGSGCSQKEDTAAQSTPAVKSSNESSENAYIKEGVNYLNGANLPLAIQSFNKAIAQNPKDPKPYYILAEVYMRLNNYAGAIINLTKVVELEPDNGPAYYFLGICKGLSGQRQEAIKDVERSAAIFQNKKDEDNFKKALATVQQMMQAENTAAPNVTESN